MQSAKWVAEKIQEFVKRIEDLEETTKRPGTM